MNEDDSFHALMKPGEEENFFEIDDLPEFKPENGTQYNRTHALWLMEFSRLIYRQEQNEVNPPPGIKTRNDFLQAKGWKEAAFFNLENTQVGIFVKADNTFAALVFRGTLGLADTITDAEALPDIWSGSGKIHNGFKVAFKAVWEDPLRKKLLEVGLPFFITGHSLGAALATLAAARCLKDAAFNNCRPIALYTFGSPRVGDKEFAKDTQGIFHCRVVNDKDVVPTVPPPVPLIAEYQHVGQMHRIENDHLHIFPPGFDEVKIPPPGDSVAKVLKDLEETLVKLRGIGLKPPEFLRDHTPVNYTARLERAS